MLDDDEEEHEDNDASDEEENDATAAVDINDLRDFQKQGTPTPKQRKRRYNSLAEASDVYNAKFDQTNDPKFASWISPSLTRTTQPHLVTGMQYNYLDPNASPEENDNTFRSELISLIYNEIRLEARIDQLIREYYFLVFRSAKFVLTDWITHLNKLCKYILMNYILFVNIYICLYTHISFIVYL